MTREQQLEQDYPWIHWRHPVRVRLIDGTLNMLGCRYCIAMKGLKGTEIEKECFQTEAEFAAHLERHHGKHDVS